MSAVSFLTRWCAEPFARVAGRLSRSRARRRTSRAFEAYCSDADPRKLLIGSGHNSVAGWFATDVAPRPRSGIYYLDAIQPFPIPDASVDYIATEHMIEHVNRDGARLMLREVLRVLRPGGTVRIATPDLARLLGLYGRELDGTESRYLEFISELDETGKTDADVVDVINRQFYGYGHRRLYDRVKLDALLTEEGFVNLTHPELGESADPHLRGVERHGGEELRDLVRLETMIAEARKPGG